MTVLNNAAMKSAVATMIRVSGDGMTTARHLETIITAYLAVAAPTQAPPEKLKFVSCNAREAILEEVHSALKLFEYVRDTMMVSVQGSYKSFNMLLGSHLLNIYYNLQRMLPDFPAV